jgi:hypothetical protein
LNPDVLPPTAGWLPEGFNFLLPVIVKDVLHVGASQLGFIWSALVVGMLPRRGSLGATSRALCNRVWLISAVAVTEGIAILVRMMKSGQVHHVAH